MPRGCTHFRRPGHPDSDPGSPRLLRYTPGMADEERPVFPPPRPRPEVPAASGEARAEVKKVVHRPDPVVDSTDALQPRGKAKLTQEEVRALLDVTGPGYKPSPWRRRLLLLPAGGAVWILKSYAPWPIVLLASLGWFALLVIEIRRYVDSSRGW